MLPSAFKRVREIAKSDY